MSFNSLGLSEPLCRAVSDAGYEHPTPIQERSIPELVRGRDLLGCAQTGTGKTAAFALPVLQRLVDRPGAKRIRALVLSPTRELAAQIGEQFAAYSKYVPVRHTVVFGGVGQNAQVRAIREAPQVLVATPGRLLDLCAQGLLRLDGVEIFVLDEADRMLDMGFINDVRKIVAMLPKQRQTLLFSATMPPDIEALARNILRDPVRVAVSPARTTAETVEQFVYFVEKPDKRALLEHVLTDAAIERVLVFTRTKHGADRVARQLDRARIPSSAIHGNKTQGQRERALAGFKRGDIRVLVATDIAARGIDVEGVTHVINYELPEVPESYVHRIGRTGRAGASGIALSFCDTEERKLLRGIERLVRAPIAPVDEHPYVAGRRPPPARGDHRDPPAHGSRAERRSQPAARPSNGGPPSARAAQGGPSPARPSNGGPPSARAAQGGPSPARPSNGGPPAGNRSRRRRRFRRAAPAAAAK